MQSERTSQDPVKIRLFRSICFFSHSKISWKLALSSKRNMYLVFSSSLPAILQRNLIDYSGNVTVWRSHLYRVAPFYVTVWQSHLKWNRVAPFYRNQNTRKCSTYYRVQYIYMYMYMHVYLTIEWCDSQILTKSFTWMMDGPAGDHKFPRSTHKIA